ncbi:hypothetical protein F511_29000 [Dorcoceras hygrometricum]|uniref:Uncharacterized protein n=1 Tax=Dorcoceras hygrometricum TaxID=472368 RepID=A0A2Z7BQV5_9LAMI|nr:hypothetical protein F511_29000 [Dorcoceras hygrometricum]
MDFKEKSSRQHKLWEDIGKPARTGALPSGDVKEDSYKKQPAVKETSSEKRPAEYDEQGGSKQLKSRNEQTRAAQEHINREL